MAQQKDNSGALIVLAVDDERDNIELVRRALRARQDIKPMVASTSNEALTILRSVQVDILIVDHRMPGMTGVELLETAGYLLGKVPAIMLTGYPDDDAVVAAKNRKLVHWVIAKPWRADDLLRAVDFAIQLRHGER